MSEPVKAKAKQLEDYINEVDYTWLNTQYVPSPEAIEFINFIKMVNGKEGEEHKSPVMHMQMVEDLIHNNNCLDVVFRGGAKALSLETQIPTPKGNTSIEDLKVGDEVFTMEGKVTHVTHKSEVFNKPMYVLTLEDGRKLEVSEDHLNIVKRKHKKSYEVLTTKEILDSGVHYKRKTSYHTPSGKESKWFIPTSGMVEHPVKDFPLDMYTVGAILGDGSIDKLCGFTRFHTCKEDLQHFLDNLEGACSGTVREDLRNDNTVRFSLKGIGPAVKEFIGTENVYGKRIPQQILWSSSEQRKAVLRGLMDTDGTVRSSGLASFCTVSEGLANDVAYLVRSLGGEIKYINNAGNYLRLTVRTDFCPFLLPRKADKWKPCLKGELAIESIEPLLKYPDGSNVRSQCIAIADETHSFLAEDFIVTHNTTVLHEYAYLYIAVYGTFFNFGKVDVAMYVSDTMENGVKSMRNQLEHRMTSSEFLKRYVPKYKFTDDSWEFWNVEGKQFFVKGFGATTGVRGFKRYGIRPQWCGFDDLMSDKNAKSPTILADIENVVYKAARQAMHPSKRKIVWTGTPFSKADSLYKAAGSRGWHTRVYPVCEKFPCTREEFKGAWEDRFTYDFVKNEYEVLLDTGKLQAFNQELMLRVTSDEDRLVSDSDIQWYSRNSLMHNKGNYNFYITTDFATSEKQSADFSVISVWAINNKGYWFLVDGVCKRQTMDKNIDDLFRLSQKYSPKSVGVEVTGQQGGFIQWIQKEMMERDIWFNLASDGNSGNLGIRPNTNKLTRFQTVVPWFKAKRMFFPEELRDSDPLMIEMEDELRFVSKEGFKSAHDDACSSGDTLIKERLPSGKVVTRRFDELIEGSVVQGYNEDTGAFEWVEVQAPCLTGHKKTYTVTVNGETSIHLTDNHPVLTQRGWVEVSELTTEDSLVCKSKDTAISGLKRRVGIFSLRLISLMEKGIGFIKKFT
ncbi:hint domain protein [Vibrio phage 1.238.A._10N.261.52.F10]|uniref:Hint domain protein n=1 Tax=Vibrio phage 1.238.A._10N.261.52.F10 TaxID=1881231 RepID=A0A2I7RUC9_9CAUD|nr:terminase large subunit [Vibrio phage 1.238.A._10N.261.52.F10]AUR97260.1 hint domain protein [Vibrio phage 1.238.A._10N.261.52.F10]AUR97354.1 hint domain protein [Vibrio phage 1.238.B._10N.261.52.F10]